MVIIASPHIPDGALEALGLMHLYPFAALLAMTALVLSFRRKWRRRAIRSAKLGMLFSTLVIVAVTSIWSKGGELGDAARETWWLLWAAYAPLAVSVSILSFHWWFSKKDPNHAADRFGNQRGSN